MTSIKTIAVVAGMLPALAGLADVNTVTNTYSFEQFGWSGGGVVNGSFTAVFPDNATNITQSEVTAFSIAFTGNTNGDNFSLSLPNLNAVNFAINGNYDVTSGYLAASYNLAGNPTSYLGSVTGTGSLTELTSIFMPYPPPGMFFPCIHTFVKHLGSVADLRPRAGHPGTGRAGWGSTAGPAAQVTGLIGRVFCDGPGQFWPGLF